MIVQASSRVRAADYEETWFQKIASELNEGTPPLPLYRKLWEYAVICQAYKENVPGGSALGFGVGTEPLPAWFAAHGASRVVASDNLEVGPWANRDQYSSDLADLPYEGVCSFDQFSRVVEFRQIDMNRIPADLNESFDFVWSCGSFEHIGGIEESVNFLCNSMDCLKTGGVAVHTTEYNYGSINDTIVSSDLVLFRLSDLEHMRGRIEKKGGTLLPFDLEQGSDYADTYVLKHPYKGMPHLNIQVENHVTTSISLVIKKGDR